MTDAGDAPIVDLYTRNGFQGPASLLVRSSYSPGYTRVEGAYRPQRLRTWSLAGADNGDTRTLPITVLRSPTVRLDLWQLETQTPFALRDVRHDQLLFVEKGRARLETDFGVLDLEPMDMVIVPRAVSYRLSDVESLQMIILVTPEPLKVDPENAAVLDPVQHVTTPRPYRPNEDRSGEQELIVRHGDEVTSYFYDYDPLQVLDTAGAPVVHRFNLRNVSPIAVEDRVAPPARLVSGPTTETLVFYLGARQNGRPPVHHNADYDEIGVYCAGPGAFGHMEVPGTIVWVPKGVIHQGPEENVPEGYIAWLFETRAHLELTPAGAAISDLIETSLFGLHPSVKAATNGSG